MTAATVTLPPEVEHTSDQYGRPCGGTLRPVPSTQPAPPYYCAACGQVGYLGRRERQR